MSFYREWLNQTTQKQLKSNLCFWIFFFLSFCYRIITFSIGNQIWRESCSLFSGRRNVKSNVSLLYFTGLILISFAISVKPLLIHKNTSEKKQTCLFFFKALLEGDCSKWQDCTFLLVFQAEHSWNIFRKTVGQLGRLANHKCQEY